MQIQCSEGLHVGEKGGAGERRESENALNIVLLQYQIFNNNNNCKLIAIINIYCVYNCIIKTNSGNSVW